MKKLQYQLIYLTGTCVMKGDSILNWLFEDRLSMQLNIRTKIFPRATVDDFNHYVHPFLCKKLKHISIHIGTDDGTRSTWREI